MHDQLFKELLQAFFADFVRIVLPDLAERLRLEQPRFRDKERFTDTTEGEHRYLDLVAEIDTTQGETDVVLVHVEIEHKARGGNVMGLRMWRYAMQLWLRDGRSVLPIVLYLRGGEPDVSRRTVEDTVFGVQLASFTYWTFGLSRSRAADYLDRPEALAAALAALMDPGDLSAPQHRIECLRRVGHAEIDDARRYLLANIVETYIQLNEAAQAEYQALLAEEGNEEVATMEMSWADTLKAEGEARGMEKGRLEGKEEGRLEGMRTLVTDLLERRFGPLSEETKTQLLALASADELSDLFHRALSAGSLSELGL